MSDTTNTTCVISAQCGIGASSPQISRFTHNFDCIKFVIDKDFSQYATVIITSVNGNINIISEGEFLVKSFDTETKTTNLMWYPQAEITSDSGVVTYQIAAYDTGMEKSVWYSKEGRLIVTQSIDTTDFSTEIIGSSPNLVTQLLTLSKKLQLDIENTDAAVNKNKDDIIQNADSVAALRDELTSYMESVHKGEDTFNPQSIFAQSGKAVAQAIAAIVNSAPETLNTLEELATALGNDPNFATTIMTLLGRKVEKDTYSNDMEWLNQKLSDIEDDNYDHRENASNPHRVTKEQVGLGNVDNTADVDKPVSDAMKTELNKKVNKVETFGLTLMEPTTYDEEENGYSWDKVYFENKPYIPGEDVTHSVEVYSADGADKKFVRKVEGKGLSTNDFTNQYKNQIEVNYLNIGDVDLLLTPNSHNLVDAINELFDGKVDQGQVVYEVDNIDDEYMLIPTVEVTKGLIDFAIGEALEADY